MPYKNPNTGKYENPNTGEWATGMFSTCCKKPCYCLGATICGPCVGYCLRDEIVGDQDYYCCGGYCPMCCFKNSCPKFPCMCLEFCCCPFNAIMSTRYMVMDGYGLQNTCCDTCLIWSAIIIGCVVCILQFFIDIPDEVRNIVDCFICTVMGCMNTQVRMEIDKQGRPVPYVAGSPPNRQQMASGQGARY